LEISPVVSDYDVVHHCGLWK